MYPDQIYTKLILIATLVMCGYITLWHGHFDGATLKSRVFLHCYFDRAILIWRNLMQTIKHCTFWLKKKINMWSMHHDSFLSFNSCPQPPLGSGESWTGNNIRDEIKIRYLERRTDINKKNETYPLFLLCCLIIFLLSLDLPLLLSFCGLL